ncbi:MAG: PrgI family protein, partial [Patescibacteria group bacterium]|nr:PrgI family protein [Patescibacteria group bacterium]
MNTYKTKMRYQVPQFIDIEDKIAFQLTAKQLGWFAAGGVLLFVVWNFASFGLFVILGNVISGTSAALAFIKINGAPLL